MRYTIWSRGRVIGATDLAFACPMGECRGGWFHPNADGARIMPVISSILPALQAYLGRDIPQGGDLPLLPELPGPAPLADLREAFHHVASLDLELRDEHGSVIPTSSIGIQDTHVLRDLAREVMSRHVLDDEALEDDDPDGWFETTTRANPDENPHSDGERWRDPDDGVDQCWFDAVDGGNGDRDREERYQVFLTLGIGAS